MTINMKKNLYEYIDLYGSFKVTNPNASDGLYFPLANEAGLLSSITPDLKGDIKTDQHSFLTIPVAREDLHLSRASRNFWLTLNSGRAWSVSGQSVWQRSGSYGPEESSVQAGQLWHQTKRSNKKLGIEATVLSFVPYGDDLIEIMQVSVRNTSKKTMTFSATSAIPLYGRSADNLRDHRHVTSLLNRIHFEKYGISLVPTMSFNERGHLVNRTRYFVVGCGSNGESPAGFFPTIQSFVGPDGDLEKPHAVTHGIKPVRKTSDIDQGKEAIGALRFKECSLKPGQQTTFTFILGIDQNTKQDHSPLIKRYSSSEKVSTAFAQTAEYWNSHVSKLHLETGERDFNHWMRWVQLQPILRKIFGNSFLPDFDYGRGGRGWRDLWQDCLALLLSNPKEVREIILNNFKGVRIDGSNATIISRRRVENRWEVEFVADRNNITRTWMDHGIWPFLTTKLYIDQTGDLKFLFEKVPYFRDAQIRRGQAKDQAWSPEEGTALTTTDQGVYYGSILEHILIQNLIPFFNVGDHNNIRLEDADWNDGLDMAPNKGESVAFTAQYAGNLESIAALLERVEKISQVQEIKLAEEMVYLVDSMGYNVDYDQPAAKRKILNDYFDAVSKKIKGNQISVTIDQLKKDLRQKAAWIRNHLNAHEWIDAKGLGWFNGYYDNQGLKVEGMQKKGEPRMTLTGQVFQIMANIASPERVQKMIKAIDAHLWDSKLGSVRLNTNFGALQPDLGRAFSFSYGDKENGAVFSHMVVMYANALYKRGFVDEGHKVLQSLYQMAKNSQRSRIYPGLPEYFNNEGRGLYHFLTGSASWYVLTMVTEVFGVRGDGGNLRLGPKLVPSQFDRQGQAAISVPFAGAQLTVAYLNQKKAPYEKAEIKSVRAAGKNLPYTLLTPREALIQRELIGQKKQWEIIVELG